MKLCLFYRNSNSEAVITNAEDAKITNNLDETYVDGRTSPERVPSPVLVPGILKNNIAFFENLRNK